MELYLHYDNVSTKAKNDASSSSYPKDVHGQNFVGVVKNKQMTKIYDEFYENDVDDAMEKSELEKYLPSPPEKMNNESFEILKWWSDKCTTYKVLASMAKDILAVPVSSEIRERYITYLFCIFSYIFFISLIVFDLYLYF